MGQVPVRRVKPIDDPTLTVSDVDLRLSDLVGRLNRTTDADARQEIADTADRWLERRDELAYLEEMRHAVVEETPS